MIQPISNNPFAGRGLSVFDHNLALPRHRWYEFKEGFSENLVRYAIDDISKSTSNNKPKLLDPFSGSGTTLVTAGRLGLLGTGIEVNPFLSSAARAKCATGRWNFKKSNKLLDDILFESRYETPSPLEGFSTFTERDGIEKWLFNRSVLRGFTSIDKALAANAEQYYGPLRLALIASLMDCCNAKKDGKCLRYKKGWQSKGLTSENLRQIFQEKATLAINDLISYDFDASNLNLHEGDSRTKLKELKDNSYDLIVTSPPYLNSFDYSDVYRPELFVGGFTSNNSELREVRLKTLRSHVQVNWEPSTKISSQMLPPILDAIKGSIHTLWDKKLLDMVQSYFADMAEVLSECSRVVRSKGQAWIVVSTSAYAGVEVPVDLILADIAGKNGWSLRGVNVLRKIRSSSQYCTTLGEKVKHPS